MSRLPGRGAAVVVAMLCACSSDRAASSPGLSLLFLNRSPAAHVAGLSWAVVPDSSRLVAFDGSLHPYKQFTSARLATPVSVTPLGSRLLVSERTGEGLVFDTNGLLVREWDSRDAGADVYAGAATGAFVVSARSPYFVQFVPEPDTAPLIRLLDTLGAPLGRVGTVHVPAVGFLAQLANAGAIATDESGSVYFAPLVRDDVTKYDRTGAARWNATRGNFARETDPELRPGTRRGGAGAGAGAVIEARYAIVNIALALADGRLYRLGADDSAGTLLRLDVLDTASGKIVASRGLAPYETAIALDRKGQLITFAAETLLAWLEPEPRAAFSPPFALVDLRGDTIRSAAFAGRVTLVNFWASWCEPCREEFPHMAELYGEFSRADFAIAAISDDVERQPMLRFVAQYRPPFPILAGAGRMKARYHYRGLPYSLLLDRRGRVIERIFGFGGADEFADLRRTIAKEIANP